MVKKQVCYSEVFFLELQRFFMDEFVQSHFVVFAAVKSGQIMSCIKNFKSEFFWFNVFRSGHKRANGTNLPLSFWLLLFSRFYRFKNLVSVFVDFQLFLAQRLLYLSSKFLST